MREQEIHIRWKGSVPAPISCFRTSGTGPILLHNRFNHLIKDSRFLFRTTEILYARDEDHNLYMTPKPPEPKVAEPQREQRLIDIVREYEANSGPMKE